MVITAKVLKRRDAASVIVAVVIAMILWQMVSSVTNPLAGQLSGLSDGQYGAPFPGGWQSQYLQPIVWAALQFIVLEVVLWLHGMVHASLFKK